MPAHRKPARTRGRCLLRCALLLGVVVLALLAPQAAFAQGSQWAELVSAAELGERLGEYGFAIAAFEQAELAYPEPRLLFEVADAYQRRYAVTHTAHDGSQAIRSYRAYLSAQPQGREAQQAAGKLAELEAAVGNGMPDKPSAEPETDKPPTWLAVMSSVMGAQARIDGGKVHKLPLFIVVEPGSHTIELSAAGYRKQVRKMRAVSGLVQTLSAELGPEPAKLTIAGTDGAEVRVDGRFVGVTPIEEPLELPPGKRRVAVLLNGYAPYKLEVDLRPGATKELEVDLAMTGRHIGASVMMAAGGVAVLTGLGFGAASVAKDNSVSSDPDSVAKELVLERSRTYRVVSGIAAGVGLGLSVFGAALFTFDEPEVELAVEPKGPGLGGLTLRGCF